MRNTARHSENIIKAPNITKQINWTNLNWFTHWKLRKKLSFFTVKPFSVHPEVPHTHWRCSWLIFLKNHPESQPRWQKHTWAPRQHYYSPRLIKSINPCTHLFIQWRWKLWVSVHASHLWVRIWSVDFQLRLNANKHLNPWQQKFLTHASKAVRKMLLTWMHINTGSDWKDLMELPQCKSSIVSGCAGIGYSPQSLPVWHIHWLKAYSA